MVMKFLLIISIFFLSFPIIAQEKNWEISDIDDVSWLFKITPKLHKRYKMKDGKKSTEFVDEDEYELDYEELEKANKRVKAEKIKNGAPPQYYEKKLLLPMLRALQMQREWICKQPNKPQELCK